MSEEQVSKRGWVKNAVIIFLSVMLVLTFFSNTILNASLPEVAVQYVDRGTITTRLRGSGTVEAKGSYEVKLTQSREIDSVLVRAGDHVEVGTDLFLLADTESAELTSARATLEDMVLQYKKDKLAADDASSFASEERAIAVKEKALAKAQENLRDNHVTQADVDAAQKKVDTAQKRVDNLSQYAGSGGNVNALRVARDNALRELEAANIAYKTELETLEAAAKVAMADAGEPDQTKTKLYMAALVEKMDVKEPMRIAWETTNALADKAEQAQLLYEDAYEEDDYADRLSTAKSNLTQAQESLAELKEKKTSYDQAEKDVETFTGELEDLRFALEQKKDQAADDAEIHKLDLAAAAKKIARQQELVDKLEDESVDAVITAKAAGVVKSVSITAGSTAEAQQVLAVIESPDQGYTLSFPVTTEQAKRVKTGMEAEVSNYYWGAEIKATLTGIKNDPSNPSTSKLLVFTLSGEDLESGSTLSLSVGERSADYQMVVPNSALRTDSSGDFVLIVIAKSTPLGSRYVATRADVKILATDDTNSAISGSLASWDYVITTSSKPLEPGMEVRMTEN